MKTLSVALGERSYPIYIGENLLIQADLLRKHVPASQVMIVSNKTVAKHHLDLLKQTFSDRQCDHVLLPDGEQYKNVDSWQKIFDALLANKHHRSTTLIALGGGVVGDMTGFAAACYQRGVNFIQVPTSLLAQVDASVGGKTAINHPLGKNMVGAFYQPRAVIIDTNTLNTLDDRQLSNGLAEVIKTALIRDAGFFQWLESNLPKLLARDAAALMEAIERTCAIKAAIVAEDERESGVRALLNFGHTFGHAIEKGLQYRECLHGEAVAIGMVLATDLSTKMNWTIANDLQRISDILHKANLPIRPPAKLQCAQLLESMALDKKIVDGQMRLVLLKSIGHAVVTSDVEPALLAEALQQYCSA